MPHGENFKLGNAGRKNDIALFDDRIKIEFTSRERFLRKVRETFDLGIEKRKGFFHGAAHIVINPRFAHDRPSRMDGFIKEDVTVFFPKTKLFHIIDSSHNEKEKIREKRIATGFG